MLLLAFTTFFVSTSIMDMHKAKIAENLVRRFDNIIKSPQDTRLYRGLELKNGLKALVISDSSTDKSAASLTVHVGSMQDPKDLQGLAHFLEHMLFLGSEKYPDENEYSKYLQEHSGSSNAYTSDCITNFYFDIGPDYLAPALDRFAQFFVAPLFTASATDREVNAVNSEHEKNIPVDGWRIGQVERSTASKDHDYNHFGTGNIETLDKVPKAAGINVRSRLLKFYNETYSANIMRLVVLGKENLDDLEHLVLELFGEVSNKNVSASLYTSHALGEEDLKKKLLIVPVKELRKIKIVFPTPDLHEFYKAGPDFYVSHLLGHEGPKSLYSVLKEKGWVNSLAAGGSRLAPGLNFFVITIDLTVSGMDHVNDIVTYTFQYIKLVKDRGILERIYQENKKIDDMTFRFKDKESPRSYVNTLSPLMHDYPIEEVLRAEYSLEEFRPDLINQILDNMNPENMRMIVVSKQFSEKADQVEKWYGTEYAIENIPDSDIAAWKEIGLSDELALPDPNEFLTENFDLLPQDSDVQKYPYILHESLISRIWFKQDDEFKLPKNIITLDLYSPLVFMDPKHAVMTALYVNLLKDSLNEYAYAAQIAGLNWNVANSKYGLSVSVSGYNEKLPLLLKRIFDKFCDFEVIPIRFEIIKENIIRTLKNFDAEQPHVHSHFQMGLMLSERAWNKDEQLQASLLIELEDLKQYIKDLTSNIYIQGLIHGNCNKQKAKEIVALIESPFQNMPGLLPEQLVHYREVNLEEGSDFVFDLINNFHRSSCVNVFFQCSVESDLNNAIIELFSQMTQEPCFNTLRTQEQLGYIVMSGIRRISGVQGFSVLVQSDRHPIYVHQRIESFLNDVGKMLEEMPDKEFERHKLSLSVKKLEKPKQLGTLHSRFFGEISTRYYHFDRVNAEVKILLTLKKEEIVSFYKKLISQNAVGRRKLAVHVISNVSTPEVPNGLTISEERKVKDIVAFKTSRSLCPLLQPVMNVPPIGARSKL